jgi:hypothetical protein
MSSSGKSHIFYLSLSVSQYDILKSAIPVLKWNLMECNTLLQLLHNRVKKLINKHSDLLQHTVQILSHLTWSTVCIPSNIKWRKEPLLHLWIISEHIYWSLKFWESDNRTWTLGEQETLSYYTHHWFIVSYLIMCVLRFYYLKGRIGGGQYEIKVSGGHASTSTMK